MRILHLSDTHLRGDGSLHYDTVNTAAALERVLASADGLAGVDVVVCSGDLSDDGSPAAYRSLEAAVGAWADRHGAAAVYVMGNHDGREGFEQVLGARTGTVVASGVRFVRLDSAVPGRGYGEIDAEQLAWLRAELAASDLPAAVVLHHPPTPALTPLLAALELQRRDELLDVCAQANVIAVVAGHYHHSLITAERGIPVFVAPGVANTTDITAPPGHERAVIGSGYAVIDIPMAGGAVTGPPRVLVRAVAGDRDGEVIFDLGPAEVTAIAAKAGAGTAE